MGKRRSNLFVLLFVLGLVGGLGAGHRQQADQARPRPQGRRRARLPGRADRPGRTKSAAKTSNARSRSSASGSTSSASPSPRSRASGTTEISVSLPDVTNAQRAIDQVGTTAQLYFYDWEPNLIGREKAIGGHPGQTAAARRARRRPTKNGKTPGATPKSTENQQLIFAGAFPTAYDAAKLASEQEPVEGLHRTARSTKPRYYLFDKKASRTN